MTKHDPAARPDARAALHHWKQIRQRLYMFHRLSRLRQRSEWHILSIVLDVFSLFRLTYILSKRFIGWSAGWLAILFGY